MDEKEGNFCKKMAKTESCKVRLKVKLYLHIACQSSYFFLAFCHLILCSSFQMGNLLSATFRNENIRCDSEVPL